MNESNLNSVLRDKKIFLVGFMATGKTTIGKKLSNKLKIPFLDTDQIIENILKMPVDQIFQVYGENRFRIEEEKIILDYIETNKNNGFIMSLGGGSFLNNRIRSAVKVFGVSIWLSGEINTILHRLKNSKIKRPLLKKYDTDSKLLNLMKERELIYCKANLKVDIVNANKEKMSSIVYKSLIKYLKSNL